MINLNNRVEGLLYSIIFFIFYKDLYIIIKNKKKEEETI